MCAEVIRRVIFIVCKFNCSFAELTTPSTYTGLQTMALCPVFSPRAQTLHSLSLRLIALLPYQPMTKLIIQTTIPLPQYGSARIR